MVLGEKLDVVLVVRLMNVLLRSSGLISGDSLFSSCTMMVDVVWHVWNCLFRNVVRGYSWWVLRAGTVERMLNAWVLQDVADIILCRLTLFMTMGPFCSEGPLCRLIVVKNVLRLRRRTDVASSMICSAVWSVLVVVGCVLGEWFCGCFYLHVCSMCSVVRAI